MHKKRILLPVLLVMALPLVSALDASFDLPNLIDDLFGDKGLWGIIQNPQIVFGITFILYFMLFYAIFAAALRMVNIFKDGDLLNKNGKIVALALSGITNFSIFFFNANKPIEKVLTDVLGPWGILGGLLIGLIVFVSIYYGFGDLDIFGGRASLGLIGAGLAMIIFGALLTAPNIMSLGWALALIPGIAVLVGTIARGGGQQGNGGGGGGGNGQQGQQQQGQQQQQQQQQTRQPRQQTLLEQIRAMLRRLQWPDRANLSVLSPGSFGYGLLFNPGGDVGLTEVRNNINTIGWSLQQLANDAQIMGRIGPQVNAIIARFQARFANFDNLFGANQITALQGQITALGQAVGIAPTSGGAFTSILNNAAIAAQAAPVIANLINLQAQYVSDVNDLRNISQAIQRLR